MDSHRDTSIHRTNEIGLQDQGYEGRGKTHKKRLISCAIRFRETERRFHDEKQRSAKNQTLRMTSPGEVSE